jgi:hypothetical protein
LKALADKKKQDELQKLENERLEALKKKEAQATANK